MESSIDENIILYDWVSFTSKKHTPEQLISALGLSDCNFVSVSGMMGYKSRLYFDHIHVCFDGGTEDMGVNVTMSGQGCRVFETLSTLKSPWTDLFDFIHSNELHFTRLDVAYDDHVGVLNIDRIAEDTKQVNYISRFRNWSVTLSSEGTSVTIGSPKSLALVRMYDKAAERGFTDGRHWVRVELQLRDERADQFSVLPLSIGDAFAGVLINYLRFVVPDETDTNKSRWVTADYWYALCDDAARIKLFTAPGMDYNEIDCRNYCVNMAGNAIDACLEMYGVKEFVSMIKQRPCNPNPKYLRVIQEHRAEMCYLKLLSLGAKWPDIVKII